MFKTKERDIDKANIRIAVLEWRLKELMEMYGEPIGDVRRLRKELHEYKELESELEKEVDRLHLLLQERQHLEFGLGRDERKRLSDKIYQIQTEYDDMAGLNSKLSYERNALLKDKIKLEKKNQGLELDIEGMKGVYRDIVTECCDLIHEREGFLMGERPLEKDKKYFIELDLSGEVMMLLDEMAHELPEAFTTRDEGYAACVEKLVINGCAAEAKKE
jgi:predicted RNase H-like nuclease (RuvC/YqgF family)